MCIAPSDYHWISRLLHILPDPPGLVVFDIDCTLIAIDDERLRPGARELFQLLIASGYRITLWSSNDDGHVRRIAYLHNLTKFTHGMSGKSPHPPVRREALAVLGEIPLLTIDDDATEAIPGCSFHHIEPFGPYEEPVA